MPGFDESGNPHLNFIVDKFPNPNISFWSLHEIKPPQYPCSTPNCGFIATKPFKLKEHEKNCTNVLKVIAKNKTYG